MIRTAPTLNRNVGPKWEEGHMRKLSGVFPAVVIDNVDPENLGRVQVQLPQMDESGQRSSKVWARMATLMAGKNRGTWFIPLHSWCGKYLLMTESLRL